MNLSHYPQTPDWEQMEEIGALVASFSVVRFMNWQQINHFSWSERVPAQTWEALPHDESAWQYKRGPWHLFEGVPLEVIVSLANKWEVRPWVCVPHAADEEMMERMIEYVLEKAENRPILEYSNEIWNGMFSQRNHAIECGAAICSEPDDVSAALTWQAECTKQIKLIAGDSADVVVSGQFFNTSVAEKLLSLCGAQVDALAVAPYPGRNQRGVVVREDGSGRPVRRRLGEISAEVETEIKTEVADLVTAYRQLCDQHNIDLFAYEGGLHQVARNDSTEQAFNIEKRVFLDFNRSEHAGTATQLLWEVWHENGGSIACPYSLATIFENKWDGSLQSTFFGHCEIVDKEIRPLSKFEALRGSTFGKGGTS